LLIWLAIAEFILLADEAVNKICSDLNSILAHRGLIRKLFLCVTLLYNNSYVKLVIL